MTDSLIPSIKGATRWRLLPDESRTLALLEFFDGTAWKPIPRHEQMETYPSRVHYLENAGMKDGVRESKSRRTPNADISDGAKNL